MMDIHLDKFKRSQFVHLFQKENCVCLMHSLTMKMVYGGEILSSLYEIFKQQLRVDEAVAQLGTQYTRELSQAVITDLIEKGMLVTDNIRDLDIYSALFQQGIDIKNIQHMYFIPTTDCNLRCKYCFVEDENRGFNPSYMTKETAKKGLEVFAKLTEGARNISVVFYGGEPLMNADVVYFAMRYIRNLEEQGSFKEPVNISLLTNGTLVDDETVKALKETKTKVSVSIDGSQEFHDAARVDINCGRTFERAVRGYKKLQDSGLSPGISCTLCSSNVEHTEEIAEYFVQELKPSGMGFNILIPKSNSACSVDAPCELAAAQLIPAFKILREHGIYEDRVMRRVQPLIDSRVHLKDCMGVGGQIVIDPDGRVGPCQAFLGYNEYFPLKVDELHAQLASLTSEHIYRNTLFDEWCHRFPFNMKDCANCFAIAICGGGCPYASLITHGSIWTVDERVCPQCKKLMEWFIWDIQDRMTTTMKPQTHSAQTLA